MGRTAVAALLLLVLLVHPQVYLSIGLDINCTVPVKGGGKNTTTSGYQGK